MATIDAAVNVSGAPGEKVCCDKATWSKSLAYNVGAVLEQKANEVKRDARLLDARVRAEAAPRQSLVARFGLVPHTNGMQQDHPAYRELRKHLMETEMMGLKGWEGRAPNLISEGHTSVFSPVLSTSAMRWWCPPADTDAPRIIIDPFAGGMTRGLLAARAGYLYVGIDASPTQYEFNHAWTEKNLTSDVVAYKPHYEFGDGIDMPRVLREVCIAHGLPADTQADMLLTCPPYWKKEVYNGDPAIDLSHARDAATFNQMCANVLTTSMRLPSWTMGVVVVGNWAWYNMHVDLGHALSAEADIAWLCDVNHTAPLGSKARYVAIGSK